MGGGGGHLFWKRTYEDKVVICNRYVNIYKYTYDMDLWDLF